MNFFPFRSKNSRNAQLDIAFFVNRREECRRTTSSKGRALGLQAQAVSTGVNRLARREKLKEIETEMCGK